ncbi:MAG: hypothetical protein KJ630_13210 [Proteobacteria bacterium]|nr:hypothetical protein [Pseudomonadota bacterium]
MDISREKQHTTIAQTNQLPHNTEKKRMLLRFQRGVIDLENNRFEILKNSEFVEKLIEYLFTSYQTGPEENVIKVLEKVGSCACCDDNELRERAVFILSIFTEKISEEQHSPEFLVSISRLMVSWLQIETDYLSGFQFICLQLQKMLQKMLRMGLWYQTEKLIIVLSQIQKGVVQKNNLIRQTISMVHSSLAEEAFLKSLVDVYLDKAEDRRDIAQCLLLHFGSKAAAVLVQCLIDCKDKEKRFSLIEFIPLTGRVALPVFDLCLKQNPPWYVVRNLIIIISRMEDPKLYEMVRPYLSHKDIRVQLQVLNCITKLGGTQMRARLLEALPCINDELKQQVVVQLGNMGGKDVDTALCALLEKRGKFANHIQDELVLTIIMKIKNKHSDQAVKVIKKLKAERIQRFGEGDRIFQAAQDALQSMALNNSGNKTPGKHPSAYSDIFKVPVATEEEIGSLLNGNLPAAQDELALPPPPPSILSKDDEIQPVAERSNLPSKKDIIQAADPSSAIHFTIWAKLYEEMSNEEFTALHAALSLKTYLPDEMIVSRGDLQAPLFFFDNGTVNLVRNQKGEEIYLSPVGAGDLIGSDIFLTGETWNLSLYARDLVRARLFNLENLMKLQVDLPNLAEKIFTFCSGHDVVQSLLRVLDDSARAGTENVRIQRGDGHKKSTDAQLRKGTILRKLKGGLCFTLPVHASEKISVLLEKELRLSVRLSTGDVDSLPARIVGIVRSVAKPTESIVFVRFLQPLPEFHYLCEIIEFPKMD